MTKIELTFCTSYLKLLTAYCKRCIDGTDVGLSYSKVTGKRITNWVEWYQQFRFYFDEVR